jgi:hypothetical protein
VDVGAVQTNYSVSFSTEPQAISPATEIYTSTNFEAGVTLDESGTPFTAVAETIPLTLDGTGTLSGGSATTSSGVASYSTLQVNTAGTGDMLNADLALNPAASPAPVAYAQSNGFNVGSPVSPTLSVTVANAGTFIQGGNSGELEITVSNTAVGSTTGSSPITVQGVLPSGTNNGHSWNYQMLSASGAGWACGGPGGSCSYSLPLTGGNSTSTLTITVQVPNTSPATVPYSVSAYGGGDPVHTNSGTAVSSNTDNIPVTQVPATVAITAGGTQSAPINSAFTTPLTVLVTDAAGVGIPSQSVTLTAPPSGASGTFSNSTAAIIGTTASTGTVGQLAETFTANGTAGGPYSVTAIASTVSASPAFALTNLTATAMVTTWPTASAITYGQPLSASMLIGGVASVAGSFAFAFPLLRHGEGGQEQREPVGDVVESRRHGADRHRHRGRRRGSERLRRIGQLPGDAATKEELHHQRHVPAHGEEVADRERDDQRQRPEQPAEHLAVGHGKLELYSGGPAGIPLFGGKECRASPSFEARLPSTLPAGRTSSRPR